MGWRDSGEVVDCSNIVISTMVLWSIVRLSM